jgi:ABC-type uncharacterized transport system substrate-binding protein
VGGGTPRKVRGDRRRIRAVNVNAIVAAGTPAIMAAKQATSVVPIVFVGAGDPVGTGLVASLSRPGGNVTGLSSQTTDTVGKRLELLRESLYPVSVAWRS